MRASDRLKNLLRGKPVAKYLIVSDNLYDALLAQLKEVADCFGYDAPKDDIELNWRGRTVLRQSHLQDLSRGACDRNLAEARAINDANDRQCDNATGT